MFALNIMLNTFTSSGNLASVRFNGVLQRFAFTYLVVAGFATYFTFRPDSGVRIPEETFMEMMSGVDNVTELSLYSLVLTFVTDHCMT